MNSPDLSAAVWRKGRRSTDLGGECVEVAAIPSAAVWRKSYHSGDIGGNCVEVAGVPPATAWHKSRRSGDTGGECVGVAAISPAIAVRDSKDPDGPKLIFDAADWQAFTRRAKSGTHDLT